jgi:hypothetical protein
MKYFFQPEADEPQAQIIGVVLLTKPFVLGGALATVN